MILILIPVVQFPSLPLLLNLPSLLSLQTHHFMTMLQARIKDSAFSVAFDSAEPRQATAVSRIEDSIKATSVQLTWKAIGQLTINGEPEFHYSTQDVDRLEIHDLYRPHDYKGPSDLQILIGRSFVPLGLLGQCDIGEICLQQLFSKGVAQGRDRNCLSGAEIRRMLHEWHSPSVSHCPYELTPSIDGLKIRWNSFHEWEYYSIDALMKTRAGRFLVGRRMPRFSLCRASWDLVHYLQNPEGLQPCSNLSVPFNPTEAIPDPTGTKCDPSCTCVGPIDRQRVIDTGTPYRCSERLTTSGTCVFDWDEEEESDCFTGLTQCIRTWTFNLVTFVSLCRSP